MTTGAMEREREELTKDSIQQESQSLTMKDSLWPPTEMSTPIEVAEEAEVATEVEVDTEAEEGVIEVVTEAAEESTEAEGSTEEEEVKEGEEEEEVLETSTKKVTLLRENKEVSTEEEAKSELKESLLKPRKLPTSDSNCKGWVAVLEEINKGLYASRTELFNFQN